MISLITKENLLLADEVSAGSGSESSSESETESAIAVAETTSRKSNGKRSHLRQDALRKHNQEYLESLRRRDEPTIVRNRNETKATKNTFRTASSLIRPFNPLNDVDDWVELFELETRNLADDDRVRIFRTKIQDHCAAWFASMRREKECRSTFEWLSILRETFRKTAFALRNAIKNRTQLDLEDAGTFIRDIRTLCYRYNAHMTQEDMMAYISETVHPKYQQKYQDYNAHAKDTTDCEQSLRAAMEAVHKDNSKRAVSFARTSSVPSERRRRSFSPETDFESESEAKPSPRKIRRSSSGRHASSTPVKTERREESPPKDVKPVASVAASPPMPQPPIISAAPPSVPVSESQPKPFPPTPTSATSSLLEQSLAYLLMQSVKQEPGESAPKAAPRPESQVETRTCYNCKQPGHLSAQCPQPRFRPAFDRRSHQPQGPRTGNSMFCSYCKRPNHSIDQCFLLQGKRNPPPRIGRNSATNPNSIPLPGQGN